jgi:L-lysine 6-transaminase
LNGLAGEFPAVISNARGRGLFAAFDVITPEARTEIRTKCLQKGLIILPSGERSIRFRPPLNVTVQEIDLGISIIRQSIKELRT